jgi:hypothetical protein
MRLLELTPAQVADMANLVGGNLIKTAFNESTHNNCYYMFSGNTNVIVGETYQLNGVNSIDAHCRSKRQIAIADYYGAYLTPPICGLPDDQNTHQFYVSPIVQYGYKTYDKLLLATRFVCGQP